MLVICDEQSPLKPGIPYSFMSRSKKNNRPVRRQSRGRSRSRSRSRGTSTALVRFAPQGAPRTQPTANAMFRPARSEQYTGLGFDAALTTTRFRPRGRRPPGKPGTQLAIPPVVAAYADPFDEMACMVKYPDEYHGLTGTFSVRQPLIVSTNGTVGQLTDLNQVAVTPATGQSLQLFTPDPSNMVIQGVSGTKAAGPFTGAPNVFYWPNGITFTNAPGSLNAFGPGLGIINQDITASNLGSLRLLYSAARLVSGGVKFTSTLNFSTVSGTVHVAPVFVNMSRMTTTGGALGGVTNQVAFEMLNGWQAALPANLQAMATLPGYEQYPLSAFENDEFVAIFKNVGAEARLFKPTTTAWGIDDNGSGNTATRYGDANVPDNYGHYCILLYVEGVLNNAGAAFPSNGSIGEVEIALNYECQPQADTSALANTGTLGNQGGTQLCQPSAPYQPLLMAAAGNVAADIPAVRMVDDAGIEEHGFMAEVERLWGLGVKIARSVGPVVDVVAPLLASMVI